MLELANIWPGVGIILTGLRTFVDTKTAFIKVINKQNVSIYIFLTHANTDMMNPLSLSSLV